MKHETTHHVTFGKTHYNIAWPEDANEHIQSFIFHEGVIYAASCLSIDVHVDGTWFKVPADTTVLEIGKSSLSDAVIRACHTNLSKI